MNVLDFYTEEVPENYTGLCGVSLEEILGWQKYGEFLSGWRGETELEYYNRRDFKSQEDMYEFSLEKATTKANLYYILYRFPQLHNSLDWESYFDLYTFARDSLYEEIEADQFSVLPSVANSLGIESDDFYQVLEESATFERCGALLVFSSEVEYLSQKIYENENHLYERVLKNGKKDITGGHLMGIVPLGFFERNYFSMLEEMES